MQDLHPSGRGCCGQCTGLSLQLEMRQGRARTQVVEAALRGGKLRSEILRCFT